MIDIFAHREFYDYSLKCFEIYKMQNNHIYLYMYDINDYDTMSECDSEEIEEEKKTLLVL